jgi:hypothetical protein
VKFVARVAGQDLDGDGKAELVVHAAPSRPALLADARASSVGSRIGTGVVSSWRGAALTGVHPLAAIAEAHPRVRSTEASTWCTAPHEYQDLDGVAGAEFLTEPYRLTTGVSSINVRDLATGETRARLIAPGS